MIYMLVSGIVGYQRTRQLASPILHRRFRFNHQQVETDPHHFGPSFQADSRNARESFMRRNV